jgi:hypothetical protein|tara:strand:- start:341 stop:601 length:261 start_codon:yes stop_codon:yes gene_type:complete
MKVMIMKLDGVVQKDGVSHSQIDLSDLPNDFWALQWDGSSGEVEYVDTNGNATRNETITDLSPYQWCLDLCTDDNKSNANNQMTPG